MLPLELLKVIFGALSRDDYDALMLTNVLFRDVVLRDFAKEPLRYFASLTIREHESYEFGLTTGNTYLCEDNEDFTQRMRLGRVGKLEFSTRLVFDENLLEVLLPVKDAWRDGHVDTPCNFATHLLLERAFSELLFCKSMLFCEDDDGPLSQPFLSLPALRECTSLQIYRLNIPLTALEVIEWLNADAHSKEPKCLEMVDDGLDDSVENLVHHLKADFADSTRAHRYVILIGVGEAYKGQLGRFVNKDTWEVLIIGHGDSAYEIRMERKPTDHE